jgi:hypothetical protein
MYQTLAHSLLILCCAHHHHNVSLPSSEEEGKSQSKKKENPTAREKTKTLIRVMTRMIRLLLVHCISTTLVFSLLVLVLVSWVLLVGVRIA